MNVYIFESFEAAPPVTLATLNCDNSYAQTFGHIIQTVHRKLHPIFTSWSNDQVALSLEILSLSISHVEYDKTKEAVDIFLHHMKDQYL